MMHFTNTNSMFGPMHTAYYKGDVSNQLIRRNGTLAPNHYWDYKGNLPNPKKYDTQKENDNSIIIVNVTRIPRTDEETHMLYEMIKNSRHNNVRLIIPCGSYPPFIKCNISTLDNLNLYRKRKIDDCYGCIYDIKSNI